jgi:hypothetical protein
MSQPLNFFNALDLGGLIIAPSQVLGSVRLVPLLRPNAPGDLRLYRRAYHEHAAVVALDGDAPVGKEAIFSRGTKYLSYVPHGLVLSWSDDGQPVAALGSQLSPAPKPEAEQRLQGKRVDFGPVSVRVLHRMAKREARANRLRFLPLHLAMEGFLAFQFGGPDIAWTEYSRRALRDGLSPRGETAVAGRELPGFEDALRVFEMHENQVGVLVFVAEALASAFVTPTPEDYRVLHNSLLEDFYSELIYQYGLLYPTTNLGEAPVTKQ